jgi:Protein of unknown function (DUF3631)
MMESNNNAEEKQGRAINVIREWLYWQGCRPEWMGNDELIASCPCHDDDGKSLSVSHNKNGDLSIKCDAQCSVQDIWHTLELDNSPIDSCESFGAVSEIMDTRDLLLSVGEFVKWFVVLPDVSAEIAVSLFVMHTWAIDAAYATPYLAVVSAEKQSGKTRLLEVLALLVREPWHTASASEAALFRKIEQNQPTLLLDEVDAIFGSHSERTEPLRAALNAGNRRGAKAARVVGQGTKMEAQDFSVFCPKVLAGIDTGRLPETIQDRAVILHMKRRRDGEQVERLRYRIATERAKPVRVRLEKWAAWAIGDLSDATPELPDKLGDRAADAWEPLFAIADLAGGDWPSWARSAAVDLSTGDRDEVGRGTQILAAIREAMVGVDVAFTADLLKRINEDEGLPFGGWRDGKGLDGRGLSRLLKPYEVKSRTVRIDQATAKGYHAADLADAWARYLPSPEGSQASQPSHADPQSPDNPHEHGDVTDVTDVTDSAEGGGQ